MTSAKQWWKRAAAAVKDKRSIYLAMVPLPRAAHRNPDMEAAVIRATSHDERSVDYKNAARVFQWARTSPSFVAPLMWALARRATRTRSWPVALKSLLLVHGLLLLDPSGGPSGRYGRLPFDVSEFRDRSSDLWGFSAFVRAYFQFLDHRTVLLPGGEDRGLERIEKLQALLDLLMQIRPYAGGMEVGLILEAMDCVLIEIFDVYSSICSGIAAYLVGVLGSDASQQSKGGEEEEWKKEGPKGIGVLRKAADQSKKLSNYFEMCRSLGVLNAAELPPVEGIPEEDIVDLERMLNGGVKVSMQNLEEEEEKKKCSVVVVEASETVVTKEWVVFEDEFAEAKHGKPLLMLEHLPAVGVVEQWSGNLIDL